MTIQAIETHYSGYRFRSRLEARWAVFFDAMQIDFTYEPEGFRLSSGINYLPDFYLKPFCCYAEVKADDDDKVNEANEILTNFVITTKKRAMLLIGLPSDLRAVLFEYDAASMGAIRTIVNLSKAQNFETSSLAAKQARFEYGETP